MERGPLLDASYYYQNDELSDVTIIIAEESATAEATAEPAAKRQRTDDDADAPSSSTYAEKDSSERPQLHLPGHKVILCSASSVCRCQISRWTETSPHEFKLLVPPRQIEVGKLLVRCIYEQAPDLSSCSQQQLPQLLQLADKYDVQAAIVLAGRQLANIPSADLEWDTVQAVYSLPPACPDMEPFKALFTAAADRLQQEFGDLDMVWAKASANRIPKLLSLPFTGFKQLLSNESTRVVNENVVADTIGHWYCEQRKQQQLQQRQPQSKQQPQQTTQHHHLGNQQQQISETLKQQLQELMRLVRIQDCTQLYVVTKLFERDIVMGCFTREQQLLASVLAGRCNGNEHQYRALLQTSPALAADEALKAVWGAPSRLRSALAAVAAVAQRATLKMSTLRERMQVSLDTRGESSTDKWDAVIIWSGRAVGFRLIAEHGVTEVDQQPACQLHGELQLRGRSGQCAVGACSIEFTAVTGGTNITVSHPNAYLSTESIRLTDLFELGPISDPLALERALRAKQLVHPDGCLHFAVYLGRLD